MIATSTTPRADVLIVGAGVIGACSAWELARRGARVVLLDRDRICAGSSYGNAGLIVPSHSMPLATPGMLLHALRWMMDRESPFWIRPRLDPALLAWLWRFRAACTRAHVERALPVLRELSYASLALYKELAAMPGLDCGWEQRGVLSVFRTGAGFEEAVREARVLDQARVAVKVLMPEDARRIEPALLPSIAGALYFPDDAHVVPDRLVHGLARLAEESGARIESSSEVLGFRIEGRRIAAVETTRGEREADEIVLAAGAWSAALAGGLGLRLPIQAAKGYSVTVRRPPDGPRVPLLLGEAKVAVTPMADALRFAGTLELAGLDLSVDKRRLAAVARAPSLYVADTDKLELIELWRGLRPCMPDGLPAIGRPKTLDNLVIATGHAMIGVSLGPVTGRLVAELAARERPSLDLAPLDPDRF